ncbi:MAG: glycerophosphodiester phosphodiesterase [Thermaceae bacterium]|nr:glycerophosphodiester phosphodiesterase [Thermaceae bacterium]
MKIGAGLPLPLAERIAGGDWIRTAHRGAPRVAPGNSARAIEAALDLGVDLVEVDLHATKDGHLVLWHDDEVRAVDGAELAIAASSLAELQALDIGGGKCVITLEAGLNLAKGRAGLMIDLKADGLAEPIVSATRAAQFSPVVVCGGYWNTLKQIRDLAPEIGTSLTLTFGWKEVYRLGDATGIDTDAVTVDGRILSPEFVAQLHARGLAVLAWTIDRPEHMRTLLEWGVDGLTSNRPDLFAEAIKEPS